MPLVTLMFLLEKSRSLPAETPKEKGVTTGDNWLEKKEPFQQRKQPHRQGAKESVGVMFDNYS